MKVSDLMNTHVITVSPECTVTEAAKLLGTHDIGALPVSGPDGRIRGMITDRDIVIRCVADSNNPNETLVRELMTRSVVSIGPDADIRDAARLMSGEQIRRLPVVAGDRIVGMLSLADVAHSDIYEMEAAKALCEITYPDKGY